MNATRYGAVSSARAGCTIPRDDAARGNLQTTLPLTRLPDSLSGASCNLSLTAEFSLFLHILRITDPANGAEERAER